MPSAFSIQASLSSQVSWRSTHVLITHRLLQSRSSSPLAPKPPLLSSPEPWGSERGELSFCLLTEQEVPGFSRHRHYKNVVCWLKLLVCLISQSSVRSFCHLPCVFCIFRRIASFQQHPLSPHWKWKHVLGRNFPLSSSGFPGWGLRTAGCRLISFHCSLTLVSRLNELYSVTRSPPLATSFFSPLLLIMHTFKQFQEESKGF